MRCDANEILPESAVFTYAGGFGKGSPSAFANGFRYKLLLERGGMYSDTDIVCLRPFAFAEEMPYAVASERIPEPAGQVRLNGCFLKAPAGSELMRECWDACAATDPATVRWGETGPELVTRVFAGRDMRRYALAPEVINNVAILARYLQQHHGLDKDAAFAPAGAYEALKHRYGL